MNCIFPEKPSCSPHHQILKEHSKDILYLLYLGDKRVAHLASDKLHSKLICSIHNAQLAIHDLIEDLIPEIPRKLLIRYHPMVEISS